MNLEVNYKWLILDHLKYFRTFYYSVETVKSQKSYINEFDITLLFLYFLIKTPFSVLIEFAHF